MSVGDVKLGHGTCHLVFFFLLFQTFSVSASSFQFISSIHHHLLLNSFQPPPFPDNIFLHALLPSSISPSLWLPGFHSHRLFSVFPYLKHFALISRMTGFIFFPPYSTLHTLFPFSLQSFSSSLFLQQMRLHAVIYMQTGTLKACQ